MNMKKLSTAFLCLFTVMVSSCTSSEEINDLPSLSINAYIEVLRVVLKRQTGRKMMLLAFLSVMVLLINLTLGMWIAIPM